MSKKKKDKNKDYKDYPEHPQHGYNPHMGYPQYNPNMQNMNYNPNMQNPYYNQGYQGYNQNMNYNQPQFNPNTQNDLASLINLLGNIDPNQLANLMAQANQGGAGFNMDQANGILNSLRPFIPPERISMIENILNNLNSNNK